MKPQRSVVVLGKMTVPAVCGRHPMNGLPGEKPDQNRAKRSAVWSALMPEELAGAHTSLLWIAHLYKKASSRTVREFCEFSGILGFSDACFLTVCVRQYFLGFFHTFQLLVSICFCSILLFTPTLTVPELRLPLGCLYSARGMCVWYQVACSNCCWSPVQQ